MNWHLKVSLSTMLTSRRTKNFTAWQLCSINLKFLRLWSSVALSNVLSCLLKRSYLWATVVSTCTQKWTKKTVIGKLTQPGINFALEFLMISERVQQGVSSVLIFSLEASMLWAWIWWSTLTSPRRPRLISTELAEVEDLEDMVSPSTSSQTR